MKTKNTTGLEKCSNGKIAPIGKFPFSKPKGRLRSGFTIVELLIVIVVIGILAAISIVAYNGIQNRANDTAVQNDLNQMAKKAALYQAENGVYPGFTWFFNNIKISKSSYTTDTYNLYYCYDTDRTGFGIAARSTSGQTFTIASNHPLSTMPNTPSLQTACGAMGQEFFGETWTNPFLKSNSNGTSFDYGYHRVNETWKYGL